MGPTAWFRIRHGEAFSEEAFAVFLASCAIYRARIAATLEHWDTLPTTRGLPRPIIQFFDPELSDDRKVMSLPLRVDGQTLGSRALLQYSASAELYSYPPFPLVAEVEVGLTEPSFLDSTQWRHDWWDPKKPIGSPTTETLRIMQEKGVLQTATRAPGLRARGPRSWLSSLTHWWRA